MKLEMRTLKNKEVIAQLNFLIEFVECNIRATKTELIVVFNITNKDQLPNLLDALTKIVELESESNIEISVITDNETISLIPKSYMERILKSNPIIEEYLENTFKTIEHAMYKVQKTATVDDILKYILSMKSEIRMRYGIPAVEEVNVGDIIDVNFGLHLANEINGGHVHCIVLNVDSDDMVYVVPITKKNNIVKAKDETNIEFSTPEDVEYFKEGFKGGAAVLNRGKYINRNRIMQKIGIAHIDFVSRLQKILPTVYSFHY